MKMELKGTVKLKKITPEGAVYAFSLPGAQTSNLYIVGKGLNLGDEGEVVVSIPEKQAAKKKK